MPAWKRRHELTNARLRTRLYLVDERTESRIWAPSGRRHQVKGDLVGDPIRQRADQGSTLKGRAHESLRENAKAGTFAEQAQVNRRAVRRDGRLNAKRNFRRVVSMGPAFDVAATFEGKPRSAGEFRGTRRWKACAEIRMRKCDVRPTPEKR